MWVDPVVLNSARKHGVPDGDLLHAYRHPIRVFELDDLTMLIGATPSGPFLELGIAWRLASSSSCTPCPPARSS